MKIFKYGLAPYHFMEQDIAVLGDLNLSSTTDKPIKYELKHF